MTEKLARRWHREKQPETRFFLLVYFNTLVSVNSCEELMLPLTYSKHKISIQRNRNTLGPQQYDWDLAPCHSKMIPSSKSFSSNPACFALPLSSRASTTVSANVLNERYFVLAPWTFRHGTDDGLQMLGNRRKSPMPAILRFLTNSFLYLIRISMSTCWRLYIRHVVSNVS